MLLLYAGVLTVRISSEEIRTTGWASLVVRMGSVRTAGATDIYLLNMHFLLDERITDVGQSVFGVSENGVARILVTEDGVSTGAKRDSLDSAQSISSEFV